MSPLQIRLRLRRALSAFSGEADAAHLLHGAILRAILRSRGGMIVVPRDCWSMTGTETIVWEVADLGPSGQCFTLRFGDADMVAGGYSGDPSNAARIES